MSILIIADIKNNQINPATAELFTAANIIAKDITTPVYLLIPCNDVKITSNYRPDVTTIVIGMGIYHYNAPGLSKAIASIAHDIEAHYIIGLHTPFTIDFLPSVSIEYNAHCVTQVHTIEYDEHLTLARGSYSGKLDQFVSIVDDKPVVASITPGSFDEYGAKDADDLINKVIEINIDTAIKQWCTFIISENKDSSLDEADIIIGVGKGIGSKDNLTLIYNFAKFFPHSAVAGSRIVCDYGWLPYSKQVGITGKSISPKVYIACAISGSSQHIAGIKGAKTIIAINKDPYAPIFNVSHYGIVEDIFTFIPQFLEYIQRL
ncbi:MAG TPA: electron transfer flavoprotein subunit alpha/FixB family protein [Spirochaetota bacterium]|nr:electron transfer flavoprotein subunit alpha/FixB family protein [Spirochaetota bacterium]